MSLYLVLIHIHSIIRWILLILILYTLTLALIRWRFISSPDKFSSLPAMFTVSLAHLQLLTGIILYIISPKVLFSGEMMSSSLLRFFTVEHSFMMLVAVSVLTIGNIRAKKALTDKVKAKRIFFWFISALIIILAAIPWPFRIPGSGWF